MLIPTHPHLKGEPEDGCQELPLLLRCLDGRQTAFVVDLVDFWDQECCLMPEYIVNNIWFVTVLHTGTMSHVLCRWEHLER